MSWRAIFPAASTAWHIHGKPRSDFVDCHRFESKPKPKPKYKLIRSIVMVREYNALPSSLLKAGSSFVRPVQSLPERVKLSDSAMDVMTDFSKVSVVSVRAKT